MRLDFTKAGRHYLLKRRYQIRKSVVVVVIDAVQPMVRSQTKDRPFDSRFFAIGELSPS